MGLSLEAFVAESKPKREQCGVRKVLDRLDAKDRGVLEAALADESVTHVAIERVLKAEGHVVQVGRHRNGGCACGA